MRRRGAGARRPAAHARKDFTHPAGSRRTPPSFGFPASLQLRASLPSEHLPRGQCPEVVTGRRASRSTGRPGPPGGRGASRWVRRVPHRTVGRPVSDRSSRAHGPRRAVWQHATPSDEVIGPPLYPAVQRRAGRIRRGSFNGRARPSYAHDGRDLRLSLRRSARLIGSWDPAVASRPQSDSAAGESLPTTRRVFHVVGYQESCSAAVRKNAAWP